MIEDLSANGSTTEGLAVSPSLEPALIAAHVPVRPTLVDKRTLYISALAVMVALVASAAAKATGLSDRVHHQSFVLWAHFLYDGRSWRESSGILGDFRSRGGRRHRRFDGSIRVIRDSRAWNSRSDGKRSGARKPNPRPLTFLKPLSAAVAIGTGGPFGAEGPIIATGGALGSLVGQILETTPQERKTLLAAGAAAGMAATFGTPVSAVLLAIELLLFEFRPRSFIPVAFAAATAAGVRFLLGLPFPCFSSIELANPAISALIVYAIIGAIVGVAAIGATRAVYLIEDLFEKLPLHWMYWPALGAVAVGIVGIFQPRTLGVGYDNIGGELSGQFTLAAVISLCIWKFISWAIALGSGTSGGTLAPLLTIGGGLGFALGRLGILFFPHAGIVPEMAALVGMAALFAGASRAMLASIIFAFEATLRPAGNSSRPGGLFHRIPGFMPVHEQHHHDGKNCPPRRSRLRRNSRPVPSRTPPSARRRRPMWSLFVLTKESPTFAKDSIRSLSDGGIRDIQS